MFDIGIIIVMVFIMFFIWFGLYSNGFIVLENIYNVWIIRKKLYEGKFIKINIIFYMCNKIKDFVINVF